MFPLLLTIKFNFFNLLLTIKIIDNFDIIEKGFDQIYPITFRKVTDEIYL